MRHTMPAMLRAMLPRRVMLLLLLFTICRFDYASHYERFADACFHTCRLRHAFDAERFRFAYVRHFLPPFRHA